MVSGRLLIVLPHLSAEPAEHPQAGPRSVAAPPPSLPLPSLTCCADRGGEIFGITAQSLAKVQQVKTSWSLHFPIVSDEAHVLADEARKNRWADIAVAHRSDFKFGVMTQPAVLIFNNRAEVLYTWAVVPSLGNVQGGCDRPVFKDVWATVLDKLEGRSPSRKIGTHGFFSAVSL